jgi:hypothetical protein
MTVRWGSGILARFLGRLFGFPRPGEAVPVHLTIEPIAMGARWTRRMGEAHLVTEQTVESGLVFEAFGPFVCGFRVNADSQSLWYTQQYAGLRFGRRRLRLPRWLWPRVHARVRQVGTSASSEVEILAPWIGPVLRYEGMVTRVHPEPAESP